MKEGVLAWPLLENYARFIDDNISQYFFSGLFVALAALAGARKVVDHKEAACIARSPFVSSARSVACSLWSPWDKSNMRKNYGKIDGLPKQIWVNLWEKVKKKNFVLSICTYPMS